MLQIQVKPGSPFVLDGFPIFSDKEKKKKFKRSKKGALHFFSGRIVEVTKDEWEFIQKKGLNVNFVFIGESPDSKPTEKKHSLIEENALSSDKEDKKRKKK